ncbi:MAG: NAD(+)/NADH kinase [Lentisphaeria bacterium]|nr:NAD(+)/NADH kinase [Lentisphaeria bacterium]
MITNGKRVKLIGRNLSDLKQQLPNNVMLVDEDPDLIITHGGDGTLLGAEREYPGIPKLALRDCKSNPKCAEHPLEKVLQQDLKAESFIKLQVTDQHGNVLTGINDIVLHNADPCSAIRYRIWIDGKPFLQQIVGDGVVASTPFGSSAYYKSITGSTFDVGFGLAFNNSTEPMNHLVLSETSDIEIMVTRGPAILFSDNTSDRLTVNEGERIKISVSKTKAIFYGIDIFRCQDCYDLRRKFWIQHWDK